MQSIANDVWIIRKSNEIKIFGDMGVCATLIQYAPGQIMILSPTRFSESDKTQIRELGNISWLVSPNPFHHLFLRPAQEAFPTARLAGPVETARKRENLKFDLLFEGHGPWPWTSSTLTFRLTARRPLHEEFVFFHTPSKTLVVTDLLFNLQSEATGVQHFFRKLNNVDRGLAMSRLSQLTFNDRKALKNTLLQILDLKPANLIVAHGEPVIGDAEAQLRESLSWLLDHPQ